MPMQLVTGVTLADQLDSFVRRNKDGPNARFRFAAKLSHELKAKLDIVCDENRVLPEDLQRDLDDLLLAEIEDQRTRLRASLLELEAKAHKIRSQQS
ncbi:hypothetical protein [Bradyrhizobium sp. 192]|uniref:hypothetical protein n=1 Tax=Bradyrhizobium sp. 192 TaxID=2782660 RepID=UPI001FFF6074|nr:hypothetical protein [Bradyrhizobium sp. 192]UPJ55430.1 hypothetical protein IVB24_22495 [Bradyrhizobium sp. 192]